MIVSANIKLNLIYFILMAAVLLTNCKPNQQSAFEEAKIKNQMLEPASSFLQKFPNQKENIVKITTLNKIVEKFDSCNKDKAPNYRLFTNREGIKFPSIFKRKKTESADSFHVPKITPILTQAYQFGHTQSEHSLSSTSISNNDLSLAIDQTKVMMTYNIFQIALELVKKNISLSIKSIESMEQHLKSPRMAQESCKQCIQYYDNVFENWKTYTMYQTLNNGPRSQGYSEIENDMQQIIFEYPIIRIMSEDKTKRTGTEESVFKTTLEKALQRVKLELSKKEEELINDHYKSILYFPTEIDASLAHQANILKSSEDNDNSTVIIGSYCQILSDIYDDFDRQKAIRSTALIAGAIAVGFLTTPVAVAAIGATAFTASDIYFRYREYEKSLYRCNAFLPLLSKNNPDQCETASNGIDCNHILQYTPLGRENKCSQDEMANIENKKPGFIGSAAELILGGAGVFTKLLSRIGRSTVVRSNRNLPTPKKTKFCLAGSCSINNVDWDVTKWQQLSAKAAGKDANLDDFENVSNFAEDTAQIFLKEITKNNPSNADEFYKQANEWFKRSADYLVKAAEKYPNQKEKIFKTLQSKFESSAQSGEKYIDFYVKNGAKLSQIPDRDFINISISATANYIKSGDAESAIRVFKKAESTVYQLTRETGGFYRSIQGEFGTNYANHPFKEAIDKTYSIVNSAIK